MEYKQSETLCYLAGVYGLADHLYRFCCQLLLTCTHSIYGILEKSRVGPLRWIRMPPDIDLELPLPWFTSLLADSDPVSWVVHATAKTTLETTALSTLACPRTWGSGLLAIKHAISVGPRLKGKGKGKAVAVEVDA